MNATIVRNGPNSQAAPCAVPAPLNRNENECVRLKNSSAIADPERGDQLGGHRDVQQATQELAADHVRDRAEDQDADGEQAGLGRVSELSPIAGPRNWAANSATVASAMVRPQL